MRIGIIGAGNIGGALASRFSELGHDVSIANSRGPDTLRAVAAETGATAVTAREGRIDEIEGGVPESAWVAEQLGRPVVKVFNNIYAQHLHDLGRPKGASGRIALPVAGDDPEAKAAVMALVDELGFDAVDAGGLADSWRQQPGTPAYGTDLDADSLKRALSETSPERPPDFRAP